MRQSRTGLIIELRYGIPGLNLTGVDAETLHAVKQRTAFHSESKRCYIWTTNTTICLTQRVDNARLLFEVAHNLRRIYSIVHLVQILVVRGATVMRGYWNNPNETEAAFRDGMFRTGDIGYQDTEGICALQLAGALAVVASIVLTSSCTHSVGEIVAHKNAGDEAYVAGNYTEAERHYRAALKKAENSDPDHVMTLICLRLSLLETLSTV